MVRTALLALLLVAALPAAATSGALPSPSEPSGPSGPTEPTGADDARSNVALLTLEAPVTSGTTRQSLDVATAVAIERDAATARLERRTLDERLALMDDGPSRQDRLVQELLGARRSAGALRADEDALRTAYVNGSIDTAAFVRGLARLDARAELLRTRLDAIGDHAAGTPDFSFRGRLDTIDATLVGLDGPVRDHALASLRGEESPIRLYAAASPRGTVLSMIADDRYVREAYRADLQTVAPGSRLLVDQAFERVVAVYPDANETVQGQSGLGVSIESGIGANRYRIEFRLPDGTITAYLDSDTEDVFYEIRTQSLSASPPAAEAAANGTRLVVNRTYAGGPLRIAVTDNATGAPTPATVEVDGERLETGEDGVVWTLSPRDARFTVAATGPAGRVSTTVRPLQPIPVAPDETGNRTDRGNATITPVFTPQSRSSER